MDAIKVLRSLVGHPLNRTSKINALSRFVRWQIASRLMPGFIVLPFVDETRLLVSRGMTGATGNWYCGLLEPAEMAFVLHALRSDDLFVDVGANVGVYTVMAAGAVGAGVIAVEPIPATYERLEANINHNSLKNVEAFNCGLAEEVGEIRFINTLDCMNRVATAEDKGPTQIVPIMTLDSLCKDRSPKIIKIDVEGYELPVLKGGEVTLSAPSLEAVLMETNGSGSRFGIDDQILFDLMASHGFLPFTYDWQQRRLIPTDGNAANTIFARNAEAISRKCQQGGTYRLVNGLI